MEKEFIDSWVWLYTPVIPALCEAEAGESLSLRPAWSAKSRTGKATQRNPVSRLRKKKKKKKLDRTHHENIPH